MISRRDAPGGQPQRRVVRMPTEEGRQRDDSQPVDTSSTSAMLAAALAYAERGKPVFPCRPNKRPYTPHGFKNASTNPEQIRKWWVRFPDALIGMPTGSASGVVVLDVDRKPKRDGADSLYVLEQANGELPNTIEVLTPSGGRHLYFSAPAVTIKNSNDVLGPGLDIRATGGYVIVPPSGVNGHRYEWGANNPDAPAPMPKWLLERIQAQPVRKPSLESGNTIIAEGQRNDSLFRIGAARRANGASGADILTTLLAENSQRCQPPLPEQEVRGIAESVERYPCGPFASVPESAESIAIPIPKNLSDDSLALHFAELHPHLRYVELRGQWLRWNGARWEQDSTGHTFADVRSMLRTVLLSDEKYRKTLCSAKTVAAVERLARVDRRLAASVDQWDREDWHLNTPAGIVDLRSGDVLNHDPEAYYTRISGASPKGTCRRWHAFLEEVTGGDRDLGSFLQRLAGYSLTGSTREHSLFFFYGTGSNGKGVFLNTLTGVLGDYAKVASMDTFTDSHSERHPTDLAALHGARLVVAQETEEGRRWAESKIKAITGGDPITARFMRQDFFTYQPRFKLLIAGNHKPRLRNVDEAIRRRFHLVPFTVKVPPEKRDPDLLDKLRAEWPGILQWGVDGCRAYLAQGLAPPSAVQVATEEYFSAQDLFSEWLDECCEKGPDFWEPPTHMFASWRAFANRRNERSGTQARFNERMEGAGFDKTRDRVRGRYWSGIRLLKKPIEVAQDMPRDNRDNLFLYRPYISFL